MAYVAWVLGAALLGGVIHDDMGVVAPTWTDYLVRALPTLAAVGAAVAAVLFGVRLVRGPRSRRSRRPVTRR